MIEASDVTDPSAVAGESREKSKALPSSHAADITPGKECQSPRPIQLQEMEPGKSRWWKPPTARKSRLRITSALAHRRRPPPQSGE